MRLCVFPQSGKRVQCTREKKLMSVREALGCNSRNRDTLLNGQRFDGTDFGTSSFSTRDTSNSS